ncbi:hypothetical protein GF406_18035 [candidate division KSB1 bacterium]|nr:hypothetical protein [candidate division KSB1 bacterium]
MANRFRIDSFEDAETKWRVFELAYEADDSDQSLYAGIVPEAGANLYSLRIGKDELLWQAPSIRDVQTREYGIPVLYPTPNRVRNSELKFSKEIFRFPPNWKEHFLHGLVHGTPWKVDHFEADSDKALVRCDVDFHPGHPLFELWPFDHRIRMDFQLESDGVRIFFRIHNRDSRPLPFGFGLHPFFKYLDNKQDTRLCVPASKHMKAVDLLPTGELEPLHPPYDIDSPKPLSDIYLDDVFLGIRPETPAWFEMANKRIKVTLEASKEFTHMVIFSEIPDFFCVENQTCSTDAHNLYDQGFIKESHLLIAEPGQEMSMWVKYRIEKL